MLIRKTRKPLLIRFFNFPPPFGGKFVKTERYFPPHPKEEDITAQIYGYITALIGKTLLLHLGRLGQVYGCRASVYKKPECFHSGVSLKDRAMQTVTAAMRRGGLPAGTLPWSQQAATAAWP